MDNPDQLDLATIGVDPPGDAALLVGEAGPAVGTLFLYRVGFVLHGFLHEQPLQFQAGLTDIHLQSSNTPR